MRSRARASTHWYRKLFGAQSARGRPVETSGKLGGNSVETGCVRARSTGLTSPRQAAGDALPLRSAARRRVTVISLAFRPCAARRNRWLRTRRGSSALPNIPRLSGGRCSNNDRRGSAFVLRLVQQQRVRSRPQGRTRWQGRRELEDVPETRCAPSRAT